MLRLSLLRRNHKPSPHTPYQPPTELQREETVGGSPLSSSHHGDSSHHHTGGGCCSTTTGAASTPIIDSTSSSSKQSTCPPEQTATSSSVGADGNKKQRVGIGVNFPPVKSSEELAQESQSQQKAFTTQTDAKDAANSGSIPPVVRSILELGHLMMLGHSCKLKACPGYQGGVFYRGKPYCIACGYRDGSKPLDMEDKANHMRLKDPMLYGSLTLPVTAMFLCQLHEEGLFDLNKPLVDYYPELGDRYNSVTARSIMKFETVLDDSAILKDCGASLSRSWLAWNPCAATQQYVYQPITKFFAAGSTQRLDGVQQRSNLLEYVRSSRSLPPIRHVPLQHGRIQHFTMALLMAVVEKQLGGQSFETLLRKKILEPSQSHAAGYGPPQLYRDPSEMFYKPTGQALQHQQFKRPIPVGADANASPALFNASLNLYATSEDYAKLLFLAVDTIHNARSVLGKEETRTPHYDFGVLYRPDRDEYSLSRPVWTGMDFVPTSSAFRYNAEFDVGVFALSSSGTRNGRFFANGFARVLQHLFLEHISKKGIDPDKSSDDPSAEKSETEKKFSKLTKSAEYTTVFKRHNAHKRF